MVEQLTCNQQVVGSNPTHGSHWDCCVPNVDVLKWTSRSTSVVIIVVLFFHVNSNLIYNIMTLITLPSGTVLANDFAFPIIVVSKVLMAMIIILMLNCIRIILQLCMLMEFRFLL